jgi:hypothetical protein|tara:strand:+ start:321 stop:431 length:111 start_codon:yes stop_codon:yes gene_type:complete
MEVVFGFLLVALGMGLIMAIIIESVEMYYRRKERNG